MTRIGWDKVGEKRYEAGVDRGVLYLADGRGVAWNGLTNVEENMGSIESNAYYYDGTKYLDTRYPGDFEGTLTAYTYPDEFLQFDGYSEMSNGVLLGHQPVYDRFGLSYRTRIGNDVDGTDHGYKIHILYNLVAIPQNRSYSALGAKAEPSDFAWALSGVPEPIAGHRPTVHIILDTTRMNPFLIRDVEDLLYGTNPLLQVDTTLISGGTPSSTTPDLVDGGSPLSAGFGQIDGGTALNSATSVGAVTSSEPKLPPLQDLIELLNSWVLIDIVDNGDGTWTATGPEEFIEMTSSTSFRMIASGVMLDDDTYQIETTHAL